MRRDNDTINIIERGDFIRFGVWELKAYKGNTRDELMITHVYSGGTIMVPSTCNGWVKYGGKYNG